MKSILVASALTLLVAFAACTQHTTDTATAATIASLQAQADSLRAVIDNLRPGLGEYMIQMKYHHDRLGEAIAAKDYDRAAYEVGEMQETAESIVHLNITNDHLTMPFVAGYTKYLKASLAALTDAAGAHDAGSLHTGYMTLTNNCNGCHHENRMAFMKIE